MLISLRFFWLKLDYVENVFRKVSFGVYIGN